MRPASLLVAASLLALSGNALATPTIAALDPASAESFAKRLFLLRRAVDRGDCEQAIQASDLIVQDFGDVKEARLGRAWVLSCKENWQEAWDVLQSADSSTDDAKELDKLIRENLAVVEITVTLDGKPLTGKESADLTPAVLGSGRKADRQPTTRATPSVYRYATTKGGDLQVLEATGQPALKAARVTIAATVGKTTKATLAWQTIPVGVLEVAVNVDGQPGTEGLPAPVATTAAGAKVKLAPLRPGIWGISTIEAGVVDVRLPATESSEETTTRVTVTPKATTTATLDVKRIAMSEITAPELASGLHVFARTGSDVDELRASPVTRRAGPQDLYATWTSPLGSKEIAEWRETTTPGAYTVGAPWAWTVKDVDGTVLLAGLTPPTEKSVELTGLRVPLTDKGSAELTLSGEINAVPGHVVTGRVDRANHPLSKATASSHALARTRALIGGVGGAAVVGAGAWMIAEIGATARASADARSVNPADGVDEYERRVAVAQAAATRSNIAMGTTIASAVGTLVGIGFTIPFGKGSHTDPARFPLEVTVAR